MGLVMLVRIRRASRMSDAVERMKSGAVWRRALRRAV